MALLTLTFFFIDAIRKIARGEWGGSEKARDRWMGSRHKAEHFSECNRVKEIQKN